MLDKLISKTNKATRDGFGDGMTALGRRNKKVVALCADLVGSLKLNTFIKENPEAILIVEVRANSIEEADIFADRIINKFKKAKLGYEYPKITGKKTERVWNLRKAGLVLLANIPGDKKAVACIEDTAVSIEDLPEYITAFKSLLSTYGQKDV